MRLQEKYRNLSRQQLLEKVFDLGVCFEKYAYAMEEKNSLFAGATFAGTGVVRDGLIITSGNCPYMELKTKAKDCTEQLALALAAAMKDKK
jgi:hypothetical protein